MLTLPLHSCLMWAIMTPLMILSPSREQRSQVGLILQAKEVSALKHLSQATKSLSQKSWIRGSFKTPLLRKGKSDSIGQMLTSIF